MSNWTENKSESDGVDPRSVIESRTPTRAPSIAGDVWVPLLQSLVWTFIVAVLLAMLQASLSAIGFLSVVTFGVAWYFRSKRIHELLWKIEQWTDTDIDGDKHKGKPPVKRVRVELVERPMKGKLTEHYIDIDGIDERDLQHLARATLEGVSLAYDKWIGGGRPFSRGQFTKLRNWLIAQGCARPETKKRNSPLVLTRKGADLFEQLAGFPTPPPQQ